MALISISKKLTFGRWVVSYCKPQPKPCFPMPRGQLDTQLSFLLGVGEDTHCLARRTLKIQDTNSTRENEQVGVEGDEKERKNEREREREKEGEASWCPTIDETRSR